MKKVKVLKAAIVGGGPGCKAIMEIIFAEKLNQLQMELAGVADTNPDAVGYRYAQENQIYTTSDYRNFYKIKDLDLIIELTGREELANEISRTKPDHIRLMDHVAARLFWDLFKIEEEMFAELELKKEALRRKTHALGERVEELNCLYGISNLMEKQGKPLDEILKAVVNLIPLAWQYPQIACSRIIYDGHEYRSENFAETSWSQRSDIIVNAERIGSLEVFFMQEKQQVDEGAFQREEKNVINLIAKRLEEFLGHRLAEEALQESEERYSTVLEASPDPVVVYDMKGRCTFVNLAFTGIFGWTPEELIGRNLDYVPDENWPETKIMIDKILAGKSFSRIESRRYTKEGNIIDVSISAAIYQDRKGTPKGSIHVLRDITARKQVEEARKKNHDELEGRVEERTAELVITIQQLRREIEERKRAEEESKASEEKYRILFNYDPNPLFVVELDTAKILDLNKQATVTYRYSRDELLGTPFFNLFENDDSQRLRKELSNLISKDEYVFVPKLWASKKDGNGFFIDFHARVGKFLETRNKQLGLLLIIRTVDITKGLERDAQLTQAGKMATLGEMATGIAHELNQPLNAIRVGSDFLAKMIRRKMKISGDQLLKVSGSINDQVDRAANIINHLREFGRRSDVRVYPVDLNSPIKDAFTIMGQQLRLRNIEVILKLDRSCPRIMSDKNRLEQIFLNLITNARDAMDAKPSGPKKLTITTYMKDSMVVAEISDTGTGMSTQILDKIFEPFFTTKEVGKGTGLGLSITYNLVKELEGKINVESTLNEGTIFRVCFPAYQEKGI
jgi:PAS domain S-box-containing protein